MSHLPNVSLRVSFGRLGLAVLLGAAIGLPAVVRGAASPVSPLSERPVIETAASKAATSTTASTAGRAKRAAAAAYDAASWPEAAVRGIDDQVLSLALGAARCATSRGSVIDPVTLTIIDYSRPSTEPRLWVLDLNTRALVYEELVAHGQGSGGNFATKFSNESDSHQTSLGLFVTEDTYVGRNGYSLRLDGLEPGWNDRARARAIVMHGAPYVNTHITQGLGRLGRSHGCPAVRETVARELIDRVKGGGLVFSYYPDARWLQASTFLNGCAKSAARR